MAVITDNMNKAQQAAFDKGEFQHGSWDWEGEDDISVKVIFNDDKLDPAYVEYSTETDICDAGMDYVYG